MQFALEPHHLGRELIAFERGADLVGDALYESNVVIFERALFAPHKTEQAERLSGDMNRRNQSRLAAKLRIEKQPDRKWQLGIGQSQCFALTQQFAKFCKRGDGERFIMLLDHLQNLAELYALGRFESCERNTLARLVQNAKCSIVGADQIDRPLHNALGNLFKIRMRIQRVSYLEQGIRPSALLFLSDIKARVLIADGKLAGDGFEKGDLFVEPLARLMRVVEAQ